MKVTKDVRRQARQIFKLSLKDGRLDASRVSASLKELRAQNQRNAEGILSELARLVKLEEKRHHAAVESATELSPDERQSISKSLNERHKSTLTTEFNVTPGLIGGLRVQIGDDVWDGSVKNRLDRLRAAL